MVIEFSLLQTLCKILKYGENLVRRKFRMAEIVTAKLGQCKKSLRRSILTMKLLTMKCPPTKRTPVKYPPPVCLISKFPNYKKYLAFIMLKDIAYSI